MGEEESRGCNHKLFRHEQNEIGYLVCTGCSVVLDDCLFSEDAVFTVDDSGRIRTDSNLVNTVPTGNSESYDRRLKKAYDFIYTMAKDMGVGEGDRIALPAKALYGIAIHRDFIKGRRCDLVAASCLYIACREQKKPFLMIEFAYYLQVDVYVLGAVFLQLVKLLYLEQHPRILKPVDPSLFVHRFVYGLIGERNKEVEKTALKIVTSMKHNWIQTGRKPSGICGAAVYLSALSHGYSFSKAQVVKTVHVCEATLTKRLIEFKETESGELTVEEFQQKTEELPRKFNAKKGKICKGGELLCVHKEGGQVPHFAHGLCEECYDEFLTMSGGLDGGSDPPAFKRAERKRLALAGSKESTDNLSGVTDDVADASGCDNDMSDYAEYMGIKIDESGCLSDVDDDEIENCIHTEEERKYKEKIWEELNPDYDEIKASAKDDKKPKKERKRKAAEAQTAAEAAHDVLVKRKISSKVDLEKLKELFGETDVTDGNPKSWTESRPNEDEDEVEDEVTYESENAGEADEYDEMETVGEYGEEYNIDNFHDDFDHYYDDGEAGDLDDW